MRFGTPHTPLNAPCFLSPLPSPSTPLTAWCPSCWCGSLSWPRQRLSSAGQQVSTDTGALSRCRSFTLHDALLLYAHACNHSRFCFCALHEALPFFCTICCIHLAVAAVSDSTQHQWQGFVKLIVNAYFEKRMAWWVLRWRGGC